MVFDPPLKTSLRIALHIVALAFLSLAVIALLATTKLYATALVLAGLGAMTVFSLRTTVARLERPAVDLMNDLIAGTSDVPAWGSDQFRHAAETLADERRQQASTVEFLRTLIDSMATAVFAVASDGHILLTNRAARLLVGEECATLLSATAIGPEAADEIGRLPTGARKVIKLAKGAHVLASAAQFAVPGEMPVRLIALQSVAGELDAVEMKAWQDMTRILAHEMMNSLTPITSLSESLLTRLKSCSADKDVTEAVEIIGRRSQGLMNFVEHYRAFAELPPPHIRPVPASAFVAGVDGLMHTMMSESHIAYRSEVFPPDLQLNIDPRLLEQAILNLLKNAIEATSNTTDPAITFRCQSEDDRVAITVTDNGVGLSEDQLESIFIPFFTTKSRGSGIGLSLARQIACALGGQIDAQSSPAVGTVFRILLPL